MSNENSSQVSLLIDFENLVRGVADMGGEDRLHELLDVKLLFDLAEEYGRIVVARAYADWRLREVNQFQFDLYNLGIDLVHVLAKRQKNAVDVKLAVDAIDLSWELPQITTYVLVSGDRDFIHVLKALRRRGKTLIGVAPDNSASDDFASLCDRFVAYDDLRGAYLNGSHETAIRHSPERLLPVRQALRNIMSQNPEGIKGAMMMPALRRELSPTFDVSVFGFTKLSQLLHALPDVVTVRPAQGGDILILPVSGEGEAEPTVDSEQPASFAKLKEYRYERDPQERRRILREIHRAATLRPLFTWGEVASRIAEETHDSKLSVSLLSKYFSVFWQARAFVVSQNQAERPTKDREMRMAAGLSEFPCFVATYERSILIKAQGSGPRLETVAAAELLGLDRFDRRTLQYVETLLESDPSVPVPSSAGLAGPGGGVDPALVRLLSRIFSDKGAQLSKGQIINEVRRAHAARGDMLRAPEAEALFSACVEFGVLAMQMDGVTRVYRLCPPESQPEIS